MWPNQQFPAYLVTFTEEILNLKLDFLCSAWILIFWYCFSSPVTLLIQLFYLAILFIILSTFPFSITKYQPGHYWMYFYFSFSLRKTTHFSHWVKLLSILLFGPLGIKFLGFLFCVCLYNVPAFYIHIIAEKSFLLWFLLVILF